MRSVLDRKDPVSRMVSNTTPKEFVDWLIKYHGLPEASRQTVESNLREQYKWHRLQGRLDKSTTVGLIAQLLLMRQHVKQLEKPQDDQNTAYIE